MEQRPATTEELKELFGDGFSEEYQAEAQERWGDTDAWKQSPARTKRYTTADWEQIKAEREAGTGARRGDAGRPAAHVARRRWTPPRSTAPHRPVVLRPRPRLPPGPGRHVRRRPAVHQDLRGPAPGLAQYVHDAIHANADRHEQA